MVTDPSSIYGVKDRCLDCQGNHAACTNADCVWAMETTSRYIRELASRGITKVHILGVDFDNTITSKDSFPSIAPFRDGAIQCLTEFQSRGGKVILITCREGQYLEEALDALWAEGFAPDACNTQLADFAKRENLRKVYADLVIDDRSFGCPVHWPLIQAVLRRIGPERTEKMS